MKTGYERVTNFIPSAVDTILVPGESGFYKYDTNFDGTTPALITGSDVDFVASPGTPPDTGF